MATAQHVIREANLIARQFECLGGGPAAAATADHLRMFWAPLLRSVLQEEVSRHAERFSPIARQAIGMLDGPPRATATRAIPRSAPGDRATSRASS